MKTAIYAFSGDPITYGHMDIIRRASKVFDRLIVGIGVNPEKKYTFTLDERTEMAKRVLKEFPNVSVVSFSGMLVDYAYENEIPVLVRGVRSSADFNYEYEFNQIGNSQKLGIDTFMLFAKPKCAHISSSTVKNIQKEQGLIHEYVPLYVKQCIEAKMSDQYIIGVTGEIGVGKSYVCGKLIELGKRTGIKVHNIDLDKIGHGILNGLTEPRYNQVRKEICSAFGDSVLSDDGTINRKNLGEIVFRNKDYLNKLNEIMYTPLLVRIRREISGKSGIILLNAALICESDMVHLCNNNIILVSADKTVQELRLKERNLTSEQIKKRLESQFSCSEKRNILAKIISRDNQGHIWSIDNSVDSIDLFDDIVYRMNIKKQIKKK